MTFKKYFALLLAAGLFAGCGKSTPPAIVTATPVAANDEPTHAQPKLRTLKMYLGAEIIDAELALTEQEEHTGMMFRTNIQESDAMLFVLPVTQRASFWMKNCPESISAAYIDINGAIQEIHHLKKNDTNGVVAASDNIRFVLETQDGWFTNHRIGVGTVLRTEKGTLSETFLQRR